MTTKLKVLNFFGSGVNSKSAVVTRQRRLNCYYEFRKDGDKSQAVLYGTPGLMFKFNITSPNNNPLRGILGCSLGLFCVVGNTFYYLSSSGAILDSRQSLNTAVGTVSLNFNSTQVIISDGVNGYIYTPNASSPSSSTFAQIGSNYPSAAQTNAFLNGFFIAESPGTSKFFVSNNGDGTTWNALAFTSASQYPDYILAVDALNGILITYSQTHIEFWQNVGASPQPFQYISNSAIEYGLAAIFSRAHVDGSHMFLGVSAEGGYQICAIAGTSVIPVSTPDIDNIIQSFSVVSDAVALTYQVDSHKFYQITFPSANRTFIYDATTDMWGEAQTGVATTTYAVRHNGLYSTISNGQDLITDYSNGNVYTMSPTSYTDNGTTICREVTTRHAINDFNKLRVSQIFLDMETGVGLQSGQGSNPQVMMDVSKDGGRTFNTNSVERWATVGKVGQYKTRVRWRRVTQGRDIVTRFRMTDPVRFVITNGAAVVSARK